MYFLAMEMSGKKFEEQIRTHGFGRMVMTKRITPYDGELWAFDNGAFGFYKNGQDFNIGLYLKRLKIAAEIEQPPWFAVAPDIVMGGLKSLAFSNEWMRQPESEVFDNWYLAVQDGMESYQVEDAIERYDYAGLFLGGSNEFKKREGQCWSWLAKRYDINFHYARCGTRAKIRHAAALNCDSIDSALPIWRTERMNHLLSYLEDAKCTPQLTSI